MTEKTNIWTDIERERRKLARITPTEEIMNPSLYFEAEAIRMSITTLFQILRENGFIE